MELDEIRKEIDQIDEKIRDLLMQRLDCSRRVAAIKKASKDSTVYRPDREKAILERLGRDVDPDLKKEYLAVVKKIMGTSRMLQYDLLYDKKEDIFTHTEFVKIKFSTADIHSVLSTLSDRGFPVEYLLKKDASEYEMIISGDIMDLEMRQLLFQLEKETCDFSVIR